MLQKKHSGFNYQQIVVLIFILLNGLFSAAPYIHASAIQQVRINNSDIPVQHQCNDHEESLLHNIQDEPQENHVAVRNKQKISNHSSLVNYRLRDTYLNSSKDRWFNSSNDFLTRHPCYSFLSIYYLF